MCSRYDSEGDCVDCGKPKHKGGPCKCEVTPCHECSTTTDHTWRDSWTGRELCDACVRRATWGAPAGAA